MDWNKDMVLKIQIQEKKTLFNKLNQIGKGEPELFAQAVDEMKGHQYANTQQRVQATGDNFRLKNLTNLRNEMAK